ncbi:DUF927 domain-containing protein [Salmonella enterica subsp. enterica]|nr:DUF927 domain-containing protein [Salmonella enterica subsp. enterica]
MKSKLTVKLLALSIMSAGQNKAYRLVKIYNTNNERYERLLIPSSEIDDKRILRKRLLDAGLSQELDDDEWSEIYINLRQNPKKRVLLCDKPGYVNVDGKLCYLTVNNYLIGKCSSYAPLAYPGSSAFSNNESSQGTLEEWQKYVAVYVLHSPQMVLALCSAFAGYCIHFTEIETGGFHLYAKSSKGKSTTLLVAASVRGTKELIKSWKMTETASEEIAAAHNDNVLLLNELKLLHKDESKAAQLAQHIIYLLSEECGKQRAAGYQQYPVRWRLIALSTGEWSLGQHAENGSMERLGGEQVRFVDVPANNENGYGIFATLPEGLSGGEFAEMLQVNCSRYYGTAGQAFVSKLLSKNNKLISEKLTRLVNEFLKYHDLEQSNDGVKRRIATRFALTYAAGVLAIKFGILPFDEEEIMAAISYCYLSAVNPMKAKFSDIFKKEFLDELIKNDFDDIRFIKAKKDIVNDINILKMKVNNTAVFAVDKDFFKENITTSLKNAIDVLIKNNVLYADAKGKTTRQIPYRGERLARRYCLKRDELLRLISY